MLFRDIIGQEDVKSLLRNNVATSHIAHAIGFSGKSGIGKLRLALAYLQYMNCQSPSDNDSCGKCINCRMFADFAHPNLHWVYPIVKAEGGKTTLSVDYFEKFRQLLETKDYFDIDDWIRHLETENRQIRIFENESDSIAQFLSRPAYNKGYKGVIIWQPDKMNDVFANKILKLLEEPPLHSLFILVGEHLDELLPTIKSRLQILRVPNLTYDDISRYLEDKLPFEQRSRIARIAMGSILKAKKITEEDEQTELFFEYFVSLMRNAWLVGHKKNYDALVNLREWSVQIAENPSGREFQKAFLQYVQKQIRENFVFNFHNVSINYQTETEEAFSRNFSPFINESNVEQLTEEFDKAERQISQNGNPKIIFLDLCLQCIVLIKNSQS